MSNNCIIDNKQEILNNILLQLHTSELSSLKDIVCGIVRVIDSPDCTAKDIKDLLQLDPPLMAKILRRANSAYFCPSNPIKTVEEAILWMGLNTIKELILGHKICELFDGGSELKGYSRKRLWQHSVAVALLSKMIFRREFQKPGNVMYSIALLHDIGIITEDQLFNEKFRQVLQIDNMSLVHSEREVFGVDHTEIGHAISVDWGLPIDICNSIRYHHDPFLVQHPSFLYTATLCICDYMCRDLGLSFYDGFITKRSIVEKCLIRLKLKPEIFKILIKDLKTEINRLENEGLI